MAKLTPGVGFSQASGKIGGLSYHLSGNDEQLRYNVRRSGKPSPLQAQRAANLARFAQQWRGLTEAQRQQWIRFAAIRTDAEGKLLDVPAGGLQRFISCNMNLIEANLASILTPGPPRVMGTWTLTAVSASITLEDLSLNVQNTGGLTDVKVLYASWMLSNGRSNFSGQQLRKFRVVSGTGTVNRWTDWLATWAQPSPQMAPCQMLIRGYAVTAGGLKGPVRQVLVPFTS